MDYKQFLSKNKNQNWEENTWNTHHSALSTQFYETYFSQDNQSHQLHSTSPPSVGVEQQNDPSSSLPGHTGSYMFNTYYYNSRHSLPLCSNVSSQCSSIGSTSFDTQPITDQSLYANQSPVVSTCGDTLQENSQKRAVFSKFQLEALEQKFLQQSFLSRDERQELAVKLNLTDRQIMIWFQNRRSRLKKRGMSDSAYHTKHRQNQEFMEQLKNNERVFPVFERTLQRDNPF